MDAKRDYANFKYHIQAVVHKHEKIQGFIQVIIHHIQCKISILLSQNFHNDETFENIKGIYHHQSWGGKNYQVFQIPMNVLQKYIPVPFSRPQPEIKFHLKQKHSQQALLY